MIRLVIIYINVLFRSQFYFFNVQILDDLKEKFPLTNEQENCYKLITKDIDIVIDNIVSEEETIEGKFHFIQVKAGVGKTEFAKKIN